MLKISNVEIHGWEAAIRGMRNPKNSWAMSDSYSTVVRDYETNRGVPSEFFVGENDLKLMQTLANAGTDHGKFLRMITVTLDLNGPLYWWKEFDTYKVGTVADSCSTMHKIHAKPFEESDFSCEHLREMAFQVFLGTLKMLNYYREKFVRTKDKEYWWQMIQLLPTSYNQLRTVQLNYAVLRAMYHARRNHKLDEWHTFCEWVETLPYAKELIVGV